MSKRISLIFNLTKNFMHANIILYTRLISARKSECTIGYDDFILTEI